MKDIMIDLETLSTAPDAAVLSIGAVEFDPLTGKMGAEFHVRIDFQDAVATGRADTDTLKWWIGQEAEAGKDVTSGTAKTADALTAFKKYLPEDCVVWGNGATFDISIMENAFMRILSEDAPWAFYNVRDCRTVEAIVVGGIDNRSNYERKGTHHNALDDAKYQVEYISGMVMSLRAPHNIAPPLAVVEEPASVDDDIMNVAS